MIDIWILPHPCGLYQSTYYLYISSREVTSTMAASGWTDTEPDARAHVVRGTKCDENDRQ